MAFKLTHLLPVNTSSSNTTSYTTSSTYTPDKNALVLALIWTSVSAAPAVGPSSVTGNNLTWELVQTITYNTIASPLFQLSIYRARGTNPTNGALTVQFAAGQTGASISVIQVSGARIGGGSNGSEAIGQIVTNQNDSNTNPEVVFNNRNNPNNLFIIAMGNNTNPFGGTAEAGWTEILDDRYTTPTHGCFIMYSFSSTDNSGTILKGTASVLGGIGIEILMGETYSTLMFSD